MNERRRLALQDIAAALGAFLIAFTACVLVPLAIAVALIRLAVQRWG